MSKNNPAFVHITYERNPDDSSSDTIFQEVKSALKELGVELKPAIPHRALASDARPSPIIGYGPPLQEVIEVVSFTGKLIAIGAATHTGAILVDAIKKAAKKAKAPKEAEVLQPKSEKQPYIKIKIGKIQIIIQWDDTSPKKHLQE